MGSCNRYEGRVCAKKRKDVSIVNKKEKTIEEGVY